ncbi:MAG TPA: DUF3078 domain-containing protein [Dinghuibacter sp.]|jgi:hypothetical protein|uniref:DUF3078 domain-containing protein n=1 Tax=Dinghuibacter sp. TaxID=2024697 RepID=UPI002C81B3DB|nr:DUF3078 domain-containing protein [Dinghuibacter sp.]HTJ12889.1 DUF3078 domain-containing protein [Dinghuibacter sp.]
MKINGLLVSAAFVLASVNLVLGQNVIKDIQNQAGQQLTGLPDSIKKTWTLGGLITLNFSQGSSSNWSAGAQDFSMSLTSINNFFAVYKKGKNTWENTLNLSYGFTQTSQLGLQKNSDLIDLTSRYGRQLDSSHWAASLLFDYRSQFSNGYNYYTSSTGKDSNQLISGFMSPAYILLSPGFEYKPTGYFGIFLSPVSSRLIVCTNKNLAPNYGIDTGKTTLYMLGAFASVTYNHQILKNVLYNGRLDLYSNYLKNAGDVNVYFTNQLAMKINKILSATYSLAIIYDDNARRPDGTLWGTQLQSLLGVGLALKL